MSSEYPIMVSICCITFNHENYITAAIEGFLNQKTDFPFEIIIHDDASTDKTTAIVQRYAKKYPELIIPIIQIENQYSKNPGSILFKHVLPKVRGKYVAFCEGDDYWTDPLKIQKQVDFLEANPDYGLVYTNALIYYQENGSQRIKGGIQYFSFNHLLSDSTSQIATLTVMVRNNLFTQYKNEINPEIRMWLMDDYPIWLYISKYSKLKYLDDITAVYRYLKISASHFDSPQKAFAFITSGYEVKMFFVSKYQVNESVRLSIQNIYYKKSIMYAILCNNFDFIKRCIYFLIGQKLYIEFIGVRFLIIMNRLKIPIKLLYKILFHVWRKLKY